MDSLIPASKISNLTQGTFVGAVADNYDQRIEQKIFHAEIVVDSKKIGQETSQHVPLPEIVNFRDENGIDRMEETIQTNYNRIKQDVQQIVIDELKRIQNDPLLKHLIKK